LSGADLSNVNLSNAYLWKAQLINANLSNADLMGAWGLTPEQVKSARNWEKAKYDKDFRVKLGLPPSLTK
ncbi:pentapeptide repeat-containing protein, partial [Staphylococcus aureus]|uniref:pentapeptide repeat-containing protein n=1 Tax=Staphylococcus aureus TaxID=1280 RepID=UPI0013526C2F